MNPTYRINSPDVTCEIFDGEVLVVNLRSGAYYSLRDSAATIWPLLAAGRTAREIGAGLAANLGVGEAEAIAWVESFAAELVAEALLVGGAAAADGTAEVKASGALARPVIDRYTDMQELLKLDPIHEVDLSGWPVQPPDAKKS